MMHLLRNEDIQAITYEIEENEYSSACLVQVNATYIDDKIFVKFDIEMGNQTTATLFTFDFRSPKSFLMTQRQS